MGRLLLSPTTHFSRPMDVYDFDNTLYRGDSTVDFTLHCLWRYQRTLPTLPATALAAIRWKRGRIAKTDFKDALYKYLVAVPDVEAEVARFWETHEARIAGPCSPREGDLVISASPEFLLRDVCARRGWRLMASPVDPRTGSVTGQNCSGDEKVRRFRAAFPDAAVERFFSDSLNDAPMARLAEHAFLVKRGRLLDWPTP